MNEKSTQMQMKSNNQTNKQINKKSMYEKLDVSSIIVVGGCGSYFQVANCVLMMDKYYAKNVTNEAKQIANNCQKIEEFEEFGDISKRIPQPNSIDATASKGDVKFKIVCLHFYFYFIFF